MIKLVPGFPRKSFTVVPDFFKSNINPLILRRQVPKDLCQQVVDIARKLNQSISLTPKGYGGAVDKSFRSSTTVKFDQYSILQPYISFEVLAPYINAHWGLGKKYDHIPEMGHMYTVFNPGDYLRVHADVIWDPKTDQLVRITRRLSILTYLTSCVPIVQDEYSYSGGELLFPSLFDVDLGQIVGFRPQAGDVIIFPANDNYHHLVTEILSGQRHNIVTFTRFK